MFRQCSWGMTNSIALNTMVTLILLYLVFIHVKQRFECKKDVFIAVIIILIKISLAKPNQIGKCSINILFMDGLEAKKSKQNILQFVDHPEILMSIMFTLNLIFYQNRYIINVAVSNMGGLNPYRCVWSWRMLFQHDPLCKS